MTRLPPLTGAGRDDGVAPARPRHLGDFTLTARVLWITALALPVGAASALFAFALLRLIGLITNLVFYQRAATSLVAPGAVHHPFWLVLLAPVAGGLAVGLMARSVLTEKIARRGLHLTREYSTNPLEALFAHEVMTPEPAAPSAVSALSAVSTASTASTTDPLDDGARAEAIGPTSAVVFADHTLREVANILARHDVTRAPVVHRDQPHKRAGVITLDQLLHARRRDLHEEHHRERLIPVRRPGSADSCSIEPA